MARYDYKCPKCNVMIEIRHEMSCEDEFLCAECETQLEKQISSTFYVATGMKPSMADHKESEHTKKVKDPERAVRIRKKAFGSDAVGDPSMVSDPRHIVKRGKTLGGAQKEVDKGDFIKAAAKDPMIVKKAQEVLRKKK